MYYAQPPSETISLTLDMHPPLHSFYVYVSNYAPGKTVRMCRLVWAFAGGMCGRYHNLMNWLISSTARCKAWRRSMQKSIYIFFCASVCTCYDPLESFNENSLLAGKHNTVSGGRRARLQFVNKSRYMFYYAYFVRLLVNSENHQTRIKLMFAYLKHS